MKIKQIKNLKYSGLVHDITVENRHSYNIEGLVVHNSASGSLVCFSMGITGIDPIRYNLVFSRFLNAGRKDSLPDIDCLAQGTSVKTHLGMTAIQYVKKGDYIYDKKNQVQVVLLNQARRIKLDELLFKITWDDGSYTITNQSHKFIFGDKEITPLSIFWNSDRKLVSGIRKVVSIERIDSEEYRNNIWLYDISVTGDHTFQLANGAISHNCDWSPKDRPRLITYLKDKYGDDYVAEIGTHGILYAKSSIRDVARILGEPTGVGDEIAAHVPDPGRGKDITFEFAETQPKWKEYLEDNPKAKEIVSLAKQLEGIKKNSSIHAGGIVISGKPIYTRAPLVRQKDADRGLATGYDMNDCEAAGLVKFDVLRVSNIEVLDRVIKSVYREEGIKIDIDNLPLDDPDVYKLFNTGKTVGIFQFEGGDARNPNSLAGLAKKVGIYNLNDLSDMIALYRPGVLDNNLHTVYIENRFKEREAKNDE